MSIQEAKLSKTEVVSVYTKTARLYDLWARLTETRARKRSLDFARIVDGESVLEVATGTGLTFVEILKANPNGRNVGVDITPAMLERAERKARASGIENYQLLVGDAYRLRFADREFDLLMNNYMFDLLPERDFPSVLAEFRRVLKSDGRLVLVNMTQGTRPHQNFWEMVYRINAKWLGGCRGVLLEESLRASGFREIYRETTTQFGFPSEIVVATP